MLPHVLSLWPGQAVQQMGMRTCPYSALFCVKCNTAPSFVYLISRFETARNTISRKSGDAKVFKQKTESAVGCWVLEITIFMMRFLFRKLGYKSPMTRLYPSTLGPT